MKKEVAEASAGGDEVLFSKYSRKDYIDNLRRISAMEMESLLIEEKAATASLKEQVDEYRLAVVDLKRAQSKVDPEVTLAEKLKAEFGEESQEYSRQKDIVKMWSTMLTGAEADLTAKKQQYEEKEADVADIQKRLAMKRIQHEGLHGDFHVLAAGRNVKGLCPTPMVYPIPDKVVIHSDGPELLRVSSCAFCDISFPNSDIVVASCKHLYHPWCAKVVFSQGSRCVDIHCKALVHPDWHRSFGWGKPDEELEEFALRLGCDDENVRLLHARAEKARINCPNSGNNPFQYSFPM